MPRLGEARCSRGSLGADESRACPEAGLLANELPLGSDFVDDSTGLVPRTNA
jgi:hypothetical protein